ncbi:MAG TPA: SAM-dependent methyltransferase, partial [Bacillales bacterium]|nr:SAM-dependent methyltransferase [Bacillales bacterium]
VVPGITAGTAAPAYAGIPVTHRNYSGSVAFVTGHRRKDGTDDIQWEHLAKGVDTLAIYMGVSNLPRICGELIRHGRPGKTPAALVQWGTTEEQRTVTGTLTDIVEKAKQQEIQNPTMIIVGEVVQLRENIRWFDLPNPAAHAEVF